MPGLHAEADVTDYDDAESAAVDEAIRRAINQLEGVNSEADLHIRDILPSEDLDAGDDQTTRGWGGTNRVWLQGDMSSAGLMHTYTLDSSSNADGKIIVIYAISTAEQDPATTEVLFKEHTGGEVERVMFQEAHDQSGADKVQALMRNPIVNDTDHTLEIHQDSDDTSTTAASSGLDEDFVSDEIIFHGVVAEPAGITLGARGGDDDNTVNVGGGGGFR